jgi:hypothetical protein
MAHPYTYIHTLLQIIAITSANVLGFPTAVMLILFMTI